MADVAVVKEKVEYVSPSRQRGMGIVFLAAAFIIWGYLTPSLEPGTITKFVMTPGGSDNTFPDWIFNTMPIMNLVAVLASILGAYQFVRGFGKRTNAILGLISALFVFAFLSWAASGGSLNLGGLLRSSVLRAVPIALAAFAGVINERAGVINIGIEGMLLGGALVGALVGSVARQFDWVIDLANQMGLESETSITLWIGVVAAALSGVALGWIHAVMSIKYKADQIISSTMILILASGLTAFISARFMQEYQELNNPGIFKPVAIKGLSSIPFFGPILFEHNMFVYAMFFFLIVLQIALFHTRWGLRLRAVGEHPMAADTLGVDVIRTRYMAVMLSGALAGFAGAYFTLGSVGRFDEFMTAGRGFIGLAAMIFGNWAPVGSFGAGLLFGFADSLAGKLGVLGIKISSEFLLMVPYVVTMVVLAGVVGKGHMPAANGQPYDKEK